MVTALTYIVSLIIIVISVSITLIVKDELERIFRGEKEVFAFHICNVVITLMVAFANQGVMTVYILGHPFHFARQLFILALIILPVYISGHFAFQKYKSMYRKYAAAENGKVLLLNERYMKKKKWFTKWKRYNAWSGKE